MFTFCDVLHETENAKQTQECTAPTGGHLKFVPFDPKLYSDF